MFHFRRIVLAIGILFLSNGISKAQIINTLVGFEEDRLGPSGDLRILLSVSGGNTDVFSLGGGVRMQWQDPSDRVRLLIDGKRKRSDGKPIEEAVSAHLRHNRRFLPWLSSVAFIQGQQNLFQRLQERFLAGFGARLDLFRREKWNTAIGATHMFEFEKLQGEPSSDRDLRFSGFLSLSGQLNDRIQIGATSFVQPLWKKPGDLRAIASVIVRTELAGPLSLVTSADLQYDTEPPDSVETTDWSMLSGLSISL